MKIYDVFPFFNELDILEIRVNTLNDLVDEFILVEADSTFSGKPKPFFSEQLLNKIGELSKKITVHKIYNTPSNLSAFEAEHFQRDAVAKILKNKLQVGDLLMYGDVDEIPNPIALKGAIKKLLSTDKKIGHFAQDIFYYYLNNKEISGTLLSYTGEYKWAFPRKWLGTSISKWEYSQNFTPTNLRAPSHKECGWRIRNGGWHFSFIGGEPGMDTNDRIRMKIESYGHQEFNSPDYLDKIPEKTKKGKDVFNRKRSHFRALKKFDFLPKYVLENFEEFQNLIKFD